MAFNLLLLRVVVTLFYSTTLVNGNCPDESSTLPTQTSTVSDIKTTILPSPSVTPSPSPLNKGIMSDTNSFYTNCMYNILYHFQKQTVLYLKAVRIGMIWV